MRRCIDANASSVHFLFLVIAISRKGKNVKGVRAHPILDEEKKGEEERKPDQMSNRGDGGAMRVWKGRKKKEKKKEKTWLGRA